MRLRGRLAVAVAVGLLVGVATALLHRGVWVYPLLAAALPVAWGAVPALLLAGLLTVLRRRLGWARGSGTVRGLVYVAVAAIAHVVTAPVGLVLAERDVREAKAFCESLVPGLDEMRRATGSYPADVSRLASGSLPRLLTEAPFYTVHGPHFTFTILEPRELFAWHQWRSEEAGWRFVRD